MIIYLVRHGDAVPEEKDPARPLSEKGRAEVEATARGLRDQGAKADEIWHSGKLRAKQTAEIIAGVLNVSHVIEKEGLKPDDPATPIADLIRQTNKNILIAGHLPFIPKLAVVLEPNLRDSEALALKSGGVLRIPTSANP
jgi:phosphohistidine phosphatase